MEVCLCKRDVPDGVSFKIMQDGEHIQVVMSSHLALPRRGHLGRLFHMFSYLKKHQKSEMLFNTTKPDIEMADFQLEDWGLSIYGDVKEEIPPIVSFAESGPSDMT